MKDIPLCEEMRRRVFDNLSIGGMNECWEWKGARTYQGYGTVTLERFPYRVHRVTYTMWRGEIPGDLQIDHLCRNKACANPRHLELVTSRENTLRGNGPSADRARWTHCKRGHPLSGENLGIRKNGARFCRECRLERNRQSYHRVRERLT